MTGRPIAGPSAWDAGLEAMRRRLKRLRVLLTTEEVFREDGTSARWTMVRRVIQS